MKTKLHTLLLVVSISTTLFAQKINLPIEVLGEEGKIIEQRFTIDDAQLNRIANTNNLYAQVNNLSYENKASIRINDGPWISLNQANVNILTPEKERGGMAHGGYNTIRFKMTIPKTGTGSYNSVSSTITQNIVRFRFNTSDGISNGFRVVDLDILDASGNRILKNSEYYIAYPSHNRQFGVSYYIEDDPNSWKSPYFEAGSEPVGINDSIAKGRNLWYYGRNGSETVEGEDLWNHYLPSGRTGFWYGYTLPETRPIQAKCTNCHADDGRDLEIFSYSNLSIIERAKFHKMTDKEGELIAAYIRSLSDGDPTSGDVGRYGRPWNPPYQPGPTLKNEPVEKWAAGAGLDAVLENDEDMLPFLFPNGTSQEEINNFFDSDKNQDTHTLPLAIQFPDWKHWLPMIHPMDAFSKGTFYEDTYKNTAPFRYGTEDNELNPEKGYKRYRDALLTAPKKADGVTVDLGGMSKSQLENLMELHKQFRFNFRFFQAQGHTTKQNHWRTKTGNGLDALADDIPQEFAATSMARLMAVKNFELVNEFNMQDQGPDYLNPADNPSDRQWFMHGEAKHVFEIPAHITGCLDGDCQTFGGQDLSTGQFESSNWYQLQMVLTPGYGVNSWNGPVDFNYQPEFIIKASKSSGINEPLRYYHTLNNMYQVKTWSGGINPNDSFGFRLRVMGPWYFLGKEADAGASQLHGFSSGYWPTTLNNVEGGLATKVINAQFLQFLKEVEDANDTDGNLYNEGINRIYNMNGTNYWYRYGSFHDGKIRTNRSQNLDAISKTTIQDVTKNVFTEEPMYADHMYWSIKEAENLGVDCNILNRAVAWSKAAWPNIDELTTRVNSSTTTTEDVSWDTLLTCTPLFNDDFVSNKEAFIYPNPTSDIIHVVGLNVGNYQVSIYNLLGQELLKSSVSNKRTSFNLNQLNTGTYIMIVKNESYKKVFKFIKN